MSQNEGAWENIVLPKIPPPVIDLSSDTDGDVPDPEYYDANVPPVEILEDDFDIDSCRQNDNSNYSSNSPIEISEDINSNFDEMSGAPEVDEGSQIRIAENIFDNSDDDIDIKYETIEVVELHVNGELENVSSKSKEQEEEYVTFFDPLVDFQNDEGETREPQNSNASGARGGTSTKKVRNTSEHESVSPQPKPSTSKACLSSNKAKKPQKKKDKSLKTKRVRFQTNNSESESSEANEAPARGKKRKPTERKKSLRSGKRSKVQTPPDSEDSSSSSSLFEAITVFRKKPKDVPSQNAEKSTQSKPSKKPRFSRIKRSSLQLDSDSDSEEKNNKESADSGAEVETDNKRISKRRPTRNNESKMKKAAAFEKLREKRERMANKAKRQSPVHSVKTENKKESEDSDDDDESSYTSGSSPCPIVDNSTDEGSNFDGSTPSSSSVTSDAETEEEVDLEIGGSDGEKDLPKQTAGEESSLDESDGPVKSCSSSNEDETPDDGQDDARCILCKNLGSKLNLTGRARGTVTEQNFNWCKCGECDITSHRCGNYDLVCCREIKGVVDFLKEELDDSDVCVTKHSRFDRDVLKYEAYARAMSKHQVSRRYDGNYYGNFYERYSCKPNQRLAEQALADFEHADRYGKFSKCITSYLFWIFDKLGRDAGQMVIPACVHRKILERYPISEYFFSPFYASYDCGIGDRRHCKLSRNTYI